MSFPRNDLIGRNKQWSRQVEQSIEDLEYFVSVFKTKTRSDSSTSNAVQNMIATRIQRISDLLSEIQNAE